MIFCVLKSIFYYALSLLFWKNLMWRRIAVATISLAVVNKMAQSIITSVRRKVTWQFATSGIKIKFNSTVCTTTLEHLQTCSSMCFLNYFSSSFSVLSFATFDLVFQIVNYQILKHIFVGFIIFEKIYIIEICCSGYSTP